MKTWKRTAITLSIYLSSKCFLNFSCKERKTNLIFVFTEKVRPRISPGTTTGLRWGSPRNHAGNPPGIAPGYHQHCAGFPLPVNSLQAFENDWNLTESGRVLNIARSTALAEFPRPCLPKPYLWVWCAHLRGRAHGPRYSNLFMWTLMLGENLNFFVKFILVTKPKCLTWTYIERTAFPALPWGNRLYLSPVPHLI